MAFASLQEITTTTFTSAQTHNANFPATVNSGDLLLLIVGCRSEDPDLPTGFTQLWSTYPGGQRGAAYFKRAAGTEGGTTIDVHTTTGFNTMVVKILRYTGHHATSNPEVGTTATGASGTPDPPAVTPSWGSADTVFVACAVCGDGQVGTVAPTNYTGLSWTNTGVGASESSCGIATRNLTATTDNPGAFTLDSGAPDWVANTIAIRPVAQSPFVTVQFRSAV